MITIMKPYLVVETQNTSYIMRVMQSGHIEHLWYGEKIDVKGGIDALIRPDWIGGNMVAYAEDFPLLSLENACLEVSGGGKGDLREPMVALEFEDGSTSTDFIYESAQIEPYTPPKTLAGAVAKASAKALVITLKERSQPVYLQLRYVPFADTDVIIRSARICNKGDGAVRIKRLLSCQLDFMDGSYQMISFHGAWSREMEKVCIPCVQGRYVNEAVTGTSSNRANPFVILEEKGCCENAGRCYGLNLIYSGEHYASAEVNSMGSLRFVSGIRPEGFSWTLNEGEDFEAPQAVLCFSNQGYTGISNCLHPFIQKYIVRGVWQFKPRPVLLNSWEAVYFDYTQERLLEIAKSASDAGIELFVLDDGWFGERNSDSTSLGDWTENPKKLPSGLSGLASKITDMGLLFGIWVEPEMVSEDSKLFKAHPDWAVQVPGRDHAKGRSQMILDLTRPEVRAYILTEMKRLFSSAAISYVKWDMNRIFSDRYSPHLPKMQQQEFMHRYILGLYEILGALTAQFPHILFEACAGGGNRTDLGMLCYMPQIWISDNTDAICRAQIQYNHSYCYPPSVMAAHVSACPNHQTQRSVPLHTRFNVACFGLLGYELDLGKLSVDAIQEVKRQVACYKKNRTVFQFGRFYRSAESKGAIQWTVVDAHERTAFTLYLRPWATPNTAWVRQEISGLNPEKQYLVEELTQNGIKWTQGGKQKASGGLLNAAGIQFLPFQTPATGRQEEPQVSDYFSRVYQITAL